MPALKAGRIIDWGDDFDEAVFHRDFDTKAAKFAFGLNAHIAEIFFIEIGRVRIEAREHAVDGVFHQFFIGDRIDVLRTDALEDIAEEIELTIRFSRIEFLFGLGLGAGGALGIFGRVCGFLVPERMRVVKSAR